MARPSPPAGFPTALAFALVAAAGLSLPSLARGGSHNQRIVQGLDPPTAPAADLHVTVSEGKIETSTASATHFSSPSVSSDGKSVTFTGAAAKGATDVNLDIVVLGSQSAKITALGYSDPTGTIFQTVTVANVDIHSNPGGTVTASIDNPTGQPLTYANLEAATGADGSFFNGDLAAGLATGKPVALDVPASGAFQPGVTDLATFTPVTTFDTYTGLVGQVGGLDFGRATLVTPEPGTLALLASAAPALYLLWRHRKRARRAEERVYPDKGVPS